MAASFNEETTMNLYCIGCGKMFENVKLPQPSPSVYPTCAACADRPEIRNYVELLRQPTIIQQAAPSELVQIEGDFWVDAALVEEITAVLVGQQGERYVRVCFRGGSDYSWTTTEFQRDFREAQLAAAQLRHRVNQGRGTPAMSLWRKEDGYLLRELLHKIRLASSGEPNEAQTWPISPVIGHKKRRRIYRLRVMSNTVVGFSTEPHPPIPGGEVGRRVENGFAYLKHDDPSFDPVGEGDLIPAYVVRNGEWVPDSPVSMTISAEHKEALDAGAREVDRMENFHWPEPSPEILPRN